MPASTTTKSFPPECFRYSTSVSSTPALPTRKRPGSRYTVYPVGASSGTHGLGEGSRVHRRLVGVADAQAAADVDHPDRMRARGPQRVHQLEQLPDALAERLGVRAAGCPRCIAMRGEPEPRMAGDERRGAHHLVDRHAELDPALAGRDVGMGVGGDVGIDPDADVDVDPLLVGDRRQPVQLLDRLDVEVPEPARTAWRSSAVVFPTPLKTIRSGAKPAASARAISPAETMSAPAPRSRRMRSTARVLLALTA